MRKIALVAFIAGWLQPSLCLALPPAEDLPEDRVLEHAHVVVEPDEGRLGDDVPVGEGQRSEERV